MRSLTDRAGTTWEVYEVLPSVERRAVSRVPDDYRDGWLCFQSSFERRRLAPIPLGWQDWDERALIDAMLSGQPFPRRTPRISGVVTGEQRPGHRA